MQIKLIYLGKNYTYTYFLRLAFVCFDSSCSTLFASLFPEIDGISGVYSDRKKTNSYMHIHVYAYMILSKKAFAQEKRKLDNNFLCPMLCAKRESDCDVIRNKCFGFYDLKSNGRYILFIYPSIKL